MKVKQKKRVKQEGEEGIIHKSRGRPSNRAISSKIKAKALNLCRTTYKGFNPTFTSEKLKELNKITIHPETLRLWFIKGQIQYKRRKAKKHRSWRERKHNFGQMLQLDGSHHEWFETRGPKCVFMGYIDDATGNFFGRFYDYEGTKLAMDSFKRYINKYGIPQSVYLDKHTTYKSTKKPTIEEELENKKAKSQFERALEELGVEVIHAQSPQAKGRIERAFNTHQDRLVKEMRLKGISSVKAADTFLSRYYIPKHNRKFTIPARNKVNLHRPLPKALNLEKILCIKQEAALRNDFTVAYEKKLYQVLESTPARKVMVEERVNGAMLLLTNTDKTPEEVLEIYLTRWKCEESFRFLKHEYHLEDVRVRRYTGLRNTIALLHAVFYFLCVYLGRRLKMKILLQKILEKAKRFFQTPVFKQYAIADGIFRLLFNLKWSTEELEEETQDKRQLFFAFT